MRPRLTHLACLMVPIGLIAMVGVGQQPRRPSYEAIEVTNGGTIVGLVSYEGTPPARERVDVTTSEEVCHTGPIYSDKLVVSEDGGVRWALVSLKGIERGKAFPELDPEKQPTLDQSGCVFKPHVVVVGQGRPLRVLNSDGVLHNVHTWSKLNRSKNVAMPGMIKETSIKFRRPERIRITCDIHPWMEAYSVVTAHPYTVVTDKDGRFELTDVPAGKYTITMWHETLKTEITQSVTVERGKESKVEFTLSKSAQ